MKEFLFDYGKLDIPQVEAPRLKALIALTEGSCFEQGSVVGAAIDSSVASRWESTIAGPLFKRMLQRTPDAPLADLAGTRSFVRSSVYPKDSFTDEAFNDEVRAMLDAGGVKIDYSWQTGGKADG